MGRVLPLPIRTALLQVHSRTVANERMLFAREPAIRTCSRVGCGSIVGIMDRLLDYVLGALGIFLAVASIGAQIVAFVNGRSETAVWLTAGVLIGAAMYRTGFRSASQ